MVQNELAATKDELRTVQKLNDQLLLNLNYSKWDSNYPKSVRQSVKAFLKDGELVLIPPGNYKLMLFR